MNFFGVPSQISPRLRFHAYLLNSTLFCDIQNSIPLFAGGFPPMGITQPPEPNSHGTSHLLTAKSTGETLIVAPTGPPKKTSGGFRKSWEYPELSSKYWNNHGDDWGLRNRPFISHNSQLGDLRPALSKNCVAKRWHSPLAIRKALLGSPPASKLRIWRRIKHEWSTTELTNRMVSGWFMMVNYG